MEAQCAGAQRCPGHPGRPPPRPVQVPGRSRAGRALGSGGHGLPEPHAPPLVLAPLDRQRPPRTAEPLCGRRHRPSAARARTLVTLALALMAGTGMGAEPPAPPKSHAVLCVPAPSRVAWRPWHPWDSALRFLATEPHSRLPAPLPVLRPLWRAQHPPGPPRLPLPPSPGRARPLHVSLQF